MWGGRQRQEQPAGHLMLNPTSASQSSLCCQCTWSGGKVPKDVDGTGFRGFKHYNLLFPTAQHLGQTAEDNVAVETPAAATAFRTFNCRMMGGPTSF